MTIPFVALRAHNDYEMEWSLYACIALPAGRAERTKHLSSFKVWRLVHILILFWLVSDKLQLMLTPQPIIVVYYKIGYKVNLKF